MKREVKDEGLIVRIKTDEILLTKYEYNKLLKFKDDYIKGIESESYKEELKEYDMIEWLHIFLSKTL